MSPPNTTWTPENGTQTSEGVKWDTSAETTTARSYYNGARTYYNWYTATAGTTDISTTSNNASGSICPQEWTLPTSSNFVNITTIYDIANSSVGSTKLRSVPLSFGYTGFYNFSKGSLEGASSYSFYYSRTVDPDLGIYYLRSLNNSVDPQSSVYRNNGLAIRCLAKP